MTREEAVEEFVAACRDQLAAEAAVRRKAEALRKLRDSGVPVAKLPTLLSAALARAGFTDEQIESLGLTRQNIAQLIQRLEA